MQRSEKGFTLIEVMIAVAIMGIIMPVIAMTTTALLTNHQQANDHNVILHQVQNAGYWISRDVQMAKDVIFDDPSGFPLTLDIPVDTDENNNYSVDYLFDGNKLKRQVYDSSDTLILETLIAEYIDVQDTTFSTLGSNIYNLTVKVSKGEVVVERCYKVSQSLNSS